MLNQKISDNQLKLRVLDIGNNRISKIENIAHLLHLEEFWASYNKIDTLQDLEPQLSHLTQLQTVYLEGNPVQRNNMSSYRRQIKTELPQIVQIDAK